MNRIAGKCVCKPSLFLLRSFENLENLVGFIATLSNSKQFRENACDRGTDRETKADTVICKQLNPDSFF